MTLEERRKEYQEICAIEEKEPGTFCGEFMALMNPDFKPFGMRWLMDLFLPKEYKR